MLTLSGCTSRGDVGIQVDDAWARPTAMATGHEGHGGGKTTAAVYLTLTNGGPEMDRLMGAGTELASGVEMHQTIIDGNQVMRMRKVEDLPIPPGETVRFEPGSYHFMLIGLTKDLVTGRHFEMTLQFEKAGPLAVSVLVREG